MKMCTTRYAFYFSEKFNENENALAQTFVFTEMANNRYLVYTCKMVLEHNIFTNFVNQLIKENSGMVNCGKYQTFMLLVTY